MQLCYSIGGIWETCNCQIMMVTCIEEEISVTLTLVLTPNGGATFSPAAERALMD